MAACHQKEYCTIPTNGDGACAVHSVFGVPCPARDNKLFVANARGRLVATFGRTAAEFRQRLQNDDLYTSVFSALWKDGLHPILLRECGSKAHLNISATGEIVWSKVTANANIKQRLKKFVEEQVHRGGIDSSYSERAYQSFARICKPEYNGFLALFAECLEWDGSESPSLMEFGQELVKGTREVMPDNNKPSTKLDAILDPRSCFNAIRRGFLEHHGRNLTTVKMQLENLLSNVCTDLRTDPLLTDFQAAVASVANRQMDDLLSIPPNFIDEIWPFYVEALEDGGANMSYWLSYDELMALASIARVNLIIVEERRDCFYYQGDTLGCGETASQDQPIVVSVRGGGSSRVESHFERLIAQDMLEQAEERGYEERTMCREIKFHG